MTTNLKVEWLGVFENWSRAYVTKNGWRVSKLMDPEDALQECALVFAQCQKRYIEAEEGRCDNLAWFMSLYKRCVIYRFNNLSWANTKSPVLHQYANGIPLQKYTENSHGPALVALSEMSQEAQDVLKKIASAPAEFLQIALAPLSSLEVWSRKLCRLTGAALNSGILREIQSVLTKGEDEMSDTETTMNIHAEVLKNVKIMNPKFKVQTAKEEDQAYLVRVLEALAGGTKEQFEAMPKEAQNWFDTACEAANEGKSMPLPEGFESAFTGKEEKAAPKGKAAKATNGAAKETATKTDSARGRRSSLDPTLVIKITKEGDLCKPEAKGYDRLKVIKDGMTVKEALEAGVFSADLTYLRDTTKRIDLQAAG